MQYHFLIQYIICHQQQVAPTKAVAIDSAMQPQQGNKFNKFMQKTFERKHPHLANIKDKIEKIKQEKAKQSK